MQGTSPALHTQLFYYFKCSKLTKLDKTYCWDYIIYWLLIWEFKKTNQAQVNGGIDWLFDPFPRR